MASGNPVFGSTYGEFEDYEEHMFNEEKFGQSIDCCDRPNKDRNRPEIIFNEDWLTGESENSLNIEISPNSDFFVGHGSTANKQVRRTCDRYYL